MTTITALGRRFGLSRSTLLYYERSGLLSPSYRTKADARLYSEVDEARLARIVTLRKVGVAVAKIRQLLDAGRRGEAAVLEERLRDAQGQIEALRAQQRLVIELLRDHILRGKGAAPSRDQWVRMLTECAFSEEDRREWHADMERRMPAVHERFLRRIGLAPAEIRHVRALSQGSWRRPSDAEANEAGTKDRPAIPG